MLMAAGLGTRLRPFTDLLPKPLLPVMGIPTAQFAVDSLRAAGVRQVVANVHHLAERAAAGLHALEWGSIQLEVSDESARRLGSAGGIRKARSTLGSEPFFLLNADVLCDVDLARLADRHHELRSRCGALLTLAVFERGPVGGKYREIHVDGSSGMIEGLGQLAEGKPFYVGAAVLEPELIAAVPPDQPADFVAQVLTPVIALRKAGAYLSNGTWHDMGSPKFWLDTHISLIHGLEKGEVPRPWEDRLNATNERVSPGVWMRGGSYAATARNWKGPCYWSPDLSSSEAAAPGEMGPGSVLYGAAPSGKVGSGIGFGGLWSDAAR